CATSVQQLRSFAVSWPPTAPTWLYTLSLHDALPISDLAITYPISRGPFRAPAELKAVRDVSFTLSPGRTLGIVGESGCGKSTLRSEEHTSELQSRENLVCRLLLEKKKKMRDPECRGT